MDVQIFISQTATLGHCLIW